MGAAEDQIAVLEYSGGVSEDEVDGAVYVAFSVELAECLCEECVLVAGDAAPEEDGVIRSNVESHCLSALRACIVVKSDIFGDKSITCDCCKAPPTY